MGVDFKEVLQYCHTWLLDRCFHESHLPNINDYLFQEHVLKRDDIERVDKEVTTCDKIRKLLRLIETKDRSGYDVFLTAIEEAGSSHVSQRLRRVEVQLNSKVVLLNNYQTQTDNELLYKDVHDCVRENLSQKHRDACVEKVFNKSLTMAFKQATTDTQKNGETIVRHIAHKQVNVESEVADTSTSNEGKLQKDKSLEMENVETEKALEDWDTADVGRWLEMQNLPPEVRQDFEDQAIDGFALMALKEEDLEKKDELPHIKMGHRKRIIKKLEILLQCQTQSSLNSDEKMSILCMSNLPQSQEVDCESQSTSNKDGSIDTSSGQPNPNENVDTSSIASGNVADDGGDDTTRNKPSTSAETGNIVQIPEQLKDVYPRKFDSGRSKPSVLYKKGSRIREAVTRVADMLEPLEHYVAIDLTEPQSLVLFSRTLVQFICACLNERTNGRIYFGVGTDGTVVGTAINKALTEYEKMIKNLVKHCFFPEQYEVIMGCVREPNFVEVLDSDGEVKKYVCELDVVPAADLTSVDAFFVKCPKKTIEDIACMQVDKSALYRCIDGQIKAVEDVELNKYMAKKKDLYELRKYRENAFLKHLEYLSKGPSELGRKLITLLSLGNEITADLYPILVTNKVPKEMQVSMKENFSFIGDIPWKAIFDFDSNATLLTFMEKEEEKVINVIPCVTDFDKTSNQNMKNPDRLQSLHTDILTSVQPHWIFGNGYSLSEEFPQLTPVQWNRDKREAFKEAVRFFRNEIPNGRAIIVFLVLSAEIEVLLEAIMELLSVFPDQWVLIAEDEDQIAEPIFGELTRRHYVQDKSELESRSVLGMPWNQIQETVTQVYGPKKTNICQLPCSNGTRISLKERTKNEQTDLEILSASECDDSELAQSTDSLKYFEAEEESAFYKGAEVSWWNFWFNDHVLKRSKKNDEIRKNITKTMHGDLPEDSFIGKVSIYHQPGAGGTTTAKQILWDYRQMYRCAIIRSISDQTANQIKTLRNFGDNRPRPVLLLMDNLDEEPTNVLLAELEERAKHTFRSASDHIDLKQPFCVVLICFRRSRMPKNDIQSCRTLIFHELETNEIRWFQKKNKELESRNSKIQGEQEESKSLPTIDPKLLISFNIMRQNFDPDYIQRLTKEMVTAIEDPKERQLLKYIAMLNAFDVRFREIPSAAFDTMMVEFLWAPGKRFGKGAEARCWETKLSQPFRVLINETSSMTFRSIKALRITNPLLSKQVVKVLQQIEGKDETVSAMALKFLGYREIFNVSSHAKDELLKIIKNMMKQRDRLPSGKPETKFAPIIQHIIDHESCPSAVELLEKAFELTDDPYIAQQLARINIFSQNWADATKYAQKATEMKPDSSYLWDTYGRVHKNQMVEVYNAISVIPDKRLDVKEAVNVVELATRGAEIFRKVQALSELEKRGLPTNNAGYFGELEITECLLHCLNNASCFKDKEDLKKCILDENYFPSDLEEVIDTEEGAVLKRLKEIRSHTEKAMNKLEDERMQLRDDTVDEYRSNSIFQRNYKVEEIQANLDFYLGEDLDELPPGMEVNSDEACRRRRRRMNSLGANSLRRIFDLKTQLHGENKMVRIRALCHQNITSGKALAIDYQIIISVSLALVDIKVSSFHSGVSYDDIVMWSRKLYDLREAGSGIIYLEPYLFYALLNWPRSGTKYNVSLNVLKQALVRWREAYFKKWPLQREGGKPYIKKDTTIFFLAYGSELNSVVNYHELRGPAYKRGVIKGDGFWREPHVLRRLERFQGVLSRDGDIVQIKIQNNTGSKDTIDIPTSFPIRDKAKWNKLVYFVIGFSWKGAKAFDITIYDPTATDDDVTYMVVNDSANDHHTKKESKREPVHILTHFDIITKHAELTNKLKEIHDLKSQRAQGYKFKREEYQLVQKEDQLRIEIAELQWQRQRLILRFKDF